MHANCSAHLSEIADNLVCINKTRRQEAEVGGGEEGCGLTVETGVEKRFPRDKRASMRANCSDHLSEIADNCSDMRKLDC